MKALEFSRNEVRYVAAAMASRIRPGSAARRSPLNLINADPPELPGTDWRRVRTLLSGICGSDIATVEGRSARYFGPWVSFPFVMGHEIIGLDPNDQRVVIEPVLGHEARGFDAPFDGAAPGDGNDYRHIVCGHLKPGIQTGFCASTGGGWSTEFIAHSSQIHTVPEELTDEAAVMIEPAAVGVHGVLKANVAPGATVAVIGAGTMGLVTLAALRHFTDAGNIVVAAKYPEQKELAKALGATTVVDPSEIVRAVRRSTSSFAIGDDLSGGADVTIDAIGSAATINQAIGITRPRGRAVLVGMPGSEQVDLTALWHRETELVGAYTYGTETLPDGSMARTFALATELVEAADLGRLVSQTYPLDHYAEALDHAVNAGRRGAIKICFDLRQG
ncbi:MAG: zinc-binding dehydrogenase [Acidimicrobiales bacterium]|nr:zinc-binding dehydrogenase [Acidimicrobiales bacterium]